MERMATVTVLHSRFGGTTQEVIRAVDRAGFEARPKALLEWFEDGTVDHDHVLLLELGGVTQSSIIECVADSGIPLLVVHTGESVGEPTDCPIDTLAWPRQMQALQPTLLRLAQSSRPTPIRLPRHELSPDLAPLNILGRSDPFLDAFQLIKRFAYSRAPILIEGETGTGKELAARALHYFGPRKEKPFIPVNCGGYPDGLFENELFGHVRGAYTDAKSRQPGLIAQAEGGTLFLDEVDSLPAKAQVTLLRYLQDQQYRPLGGAETRRSHVSIVTATNVDLSTLVEAKTFRQDLLYRLNVVKLTMPPLRERLEDVTLLARHFLRYFSELYETAPKYFSPRSLEQLKSMEWPGNVRELENFVHREFLLAEGPIVQTQTDEARTCHCVQPLVRLDETSLHHGYNEMRAEVVNDFERQYLHRLMTNTRGNVSHAARIAGKERRSLGKLLKKHGIDRRLYQHDGVA